MKMESDSYSAMRFEAPQNMTVAPFLKQQSLFASPAAKHTVGNH